MRGTLSRKREAHRRIAPAAIKMDSLAYAGKQPDSRLFGGATGGRLFWFLTGDDSIGISQITSWGSGWK